MTTGIGIGELLVIVQRRYPGCRILISQGIPHDKARVVVEGPMGTCGLKHYITEGNGVTIGDAVRNLAGLIRKDSAAEIDRLSSVVRDLESL